MKNNLQLNDIEAAISLYKENKFPWNIRPVDWHISTTSGELYPLKYIYALAIGENPLQFTTNQAKYAMRHLKLPYVSLKFVKENEISLQNDVDASLQDKASRLRRLETANKTPTKRLVIREEYDRNPDVIAEVLDRAKGYCENCKKRAPFNRLKDNRPYLEVHHIKRLADDGDDSVENAEALCPNCHRQKHYG